MLSQQWQLSPRKFGVIIERNVRVPVGRGVSILADIYRPDASGIFPVLLTMSPYNRYEQGIEMVFGRWNGEDYYETLWRSNVVGTRNVLELQDKLRFKLIFASSSEVYGDYDGLMTETAMDEREMLHGAEQAEIDRSFSASESAAERASRMAEKDSAANNSAQ